jgi:polyhydroxyalkanoate synthesis regulator phasin
MKISPRMKLLGLGLSGLLAVGVVGAAVAEGPVSLPGIGSHGHRHPILAATIMDIVKQSGLDPSVFKEGALAGQSINDILTTNGVDPAAVEAAVLGDIQARLDQAVTNGKMTQEEADAAYAKAQEKLPELMAHAPDPAKVQDRQDHRQSLREAAGRSLLTSAASSIGIDVEDLMTELRDGQTIAQVATAHGTDPQTIINDAVAAAEAKIDQAVTDGKLSAEQAATIKSNLAERIAKLVNEGRPNKGQQS